MEEEQLKKKKAINGKRKNFKKKRRKQQRNPQSHIFPLLLAALFTKSRNNDALIKKCLNKIFLSLPHFMSTPVLALIPALLQSDCAEIACKSAEIVGAAAISSFEMNEKIVVEEEIIKSLLSLLESSMLKNSMAACHAILDLSVASVGRQQLLKFSVIEKLILCFIQVSKSSDAIVSLSADLILFKDDKYPISLLHAAICLINSCTVEQLMGIPTGLSDSFLVYLKRLWEIVYRQRLSSTSMNGDGEKEFYISNIGTNNLAESIFRLSINNCLYLQPLALDRIKKSIFSVEGISIELFLAGIWEISPMLITDASQASATHDNIFTPFVQHLGSREVIPCLLPSILKGITSCPPIASDELDILQIIREVRNQLGCPIIYNQDIRVVKTQCRERELHFFQELSGSIGSRDPHILDINDILKCEEAFREGYSIALRGMEFRYHSIAAIADGLASLFGQPSAGVNMYLTPANSQGLSRHSDDHCVFVCQIIGMKRWAIFPKSHLQLPRLYESFDNLRDAEAESQTADGCQQFLLKEGDVLYIPRGFPHEARTFTEDDKGFNGTNGFSLHLTLAIEIEPPFEWEGFMQVAVYSWYEKQKALLSTSVDSVPQDLHVSSVNLLRVAIMLIGKVDPMFRKACLVGATSLSSVTEIEFNNNQRTIFSFLINRITTESKFLDVLEHLEAALQKNEDPLEHLRWMKYLAADREIENPSSSRTLSAGSRCLLDLLCQHRDIAEAAFIQVVSKFCTEVEFPDVGVHYKVLLDKYRKVRKQYTNGMLSLHCVNEHEITSP